MGAIALPGFAYLKDPEVAEYLGVKLCDLLTELVALQDRYQPMDKYRSRVRTSQTSEITQKQQELANLS